MTNRLQLMRSIIQNSWKWRRNERQFHTRS